MTANHSLKKPSAWKRIRGSRIFLILFGMILFGITVPLDFIHSGAIHDFAEGHKNLINSIGGAAGFFAAAVFFSSYFRERASRRQDKIYTVAYRSLCQSANDVVRKLLAPLNGMDLFTEGVTTDAGPQWKANLDRLRRLDRVPPLLKSKAILEDIDGEFIRETLSILLSTREFVDELYLINARVRRETQQSTGLWAPIMLTSSHLEEDLGRFRTLSDDLEFLQQYLRELRNAFAEGRDISELSKLSLQTQEQFWDTINNAYPLFKDFAKKSDFVSVIKGAIKIDE